MWEKGDTPQERIAALAARQHGIVTAAQLGSLGISSSAIGRRVRAGHLHRIHRGVYAVGHPSPGREGRWMAAVLACGPGAALSHGDAAVLWGLLRPLEGPVHVSVPSRNGRRRRLGIELHRSPSLAPRGRARLQVTEREGIPVTTPARTVADLPGSLPPYLVRRAGRQAAILGLLGADAGVGMTRSDLEDEFLRTCRRHRIPAPETNVSVAGLTVDFLWRDARLVVETDGYAYHRGRQAFEDDRARDLRLREHGFDLIRVADRQLRDEPQRVAALVANALRPRLSAP